MPVSDEYIEYILDQLSDFGPVIPRRMFGGAGLFHDGLMFALIADDVLYLKVDDRNRSDFAAKGCAPFRPYGDERASMSYFDVPVDVVEDRDELCRWAGVAFEAAAEAGRKRSKRKGSRKSGGRGIKRD